MHKESDSTSHLDLEHRMVDSGFRFQALAKEEQGDTNKTEEKVLEPHADKAIEI